ncbi:TonB-dependent receptor [Brevundimonas sp.]|uniref:TonB-dependent receptor n=1 Tax=Brevundimonas sp. TaxID=1871086 RepID=UPI00273067B9|nr:TonB-dependent receptor [Brevundimonas sp.]MDP1912216.1 TonB-dependent receptor [Brevundimonas sp.]
MKMKTLVGSLALLGLATHALAQTTSTPQRVEITGSSIKRLADEGALPLQVITASDIKQMGVASAEELLRTLSANSANVDNATSRNNVFGAEQDRLTGGASFANLRGLGPTGTLVLLNGRRMPTHGTSGGAVDLNTIPMEAVARVEVLKDGASAIYGTDAIGGVINFILKNDFTGVSVGGTLTKPLASGGGDTKSAFITAGKGRLDTDGFNLMASLTVDKTTILRGIDRSWATGFQPERGLSPDTTSAPHANIIGAAGTALATTGSTVGATDPLKYTNLNLLAMQGDCEDVPFGVPLAPNVQLWSKFGYTTANSLYRCGTDYGRQFMLTAPKDAVTLVARGTKKLGAAHTAFVEIVGSQTDSKAEFTPYQFSTTSNAVTNYPVGGPHYLNLKDYGANQFDPTKPIAYRLRMWDWGYRTLENKSKNTRVSTGIDGDIGAYSYKAGLSWGKAEASSHAVDGYADTNKLIAALATGIINPFLMPGQEQTQAAKDLIESTKVRGRLFGGDTTLVQLDGAISGELLKLPAGALEFALGAEYRKESYNFSGSEDYTCVSTFTVANAALPNSVMGCPGNAASPDASREIGAVYGELLVPVSQSLQLQLAVRHDEYSKIGGTTNPKIAFKFQPSKNFLMRGSYNTGFRAPTAQQLNLGQVTLNLTGQWSDPEKCPTDPTQCAIVSQPYRTGGNPTLKPETSTQGTLGLAFSVLDSLQFTADYWQVKLEDRIRSLSPTFMITNYDIFRDSFIRNAAGNVDYIQAGWVNAADSETKGLDMSVRHAAKLAGGVLSSELTATKMISHKERLISTAPLVQFVGEWSSTTLYLPWKASGSIGFKKNDWNTTASFNYKDGYKDQDMSVYSVTPPPPREVASYTTFNLFTTYTGIKNLTLTGGVINLFDKDPPFTYHNVDNVVGAGWDPRVADPRGRTVSVSMRYDFN